MQLTLKDDLPLVHFAAFQQFAPETDLGIDLAREYEAAVQMHA
jgi:hypothetical protein